MGQPSLLLESLGTRVRGLVAQNAEMSLMIAPFSANEKSTNICLKTPTDKYLYLSLAILDSGEVAMDSDASDQNSATTVHKYHAPVTHFHYHFNGVAPHSINCGQSSETSSLPLLHSRPQDPL